ncbi:thiamine pyrophosphate-binding protein [Rhabdaerophilum calidifontis]|uniref:thiamine pyrophosphate-binding protein n=1 Tax=Rhabdaerophilum calidifontis TaxID=2604328 RepID=UPI001239935D|nr:thiamine pyrophosphate-binding protein [Rhabdaerophilum calidifontis]
MPSGAAIIAERLAAEGCRIAFGMPGGEVLALIDGLAQAGIRFVLTKHENAAGFMAEGFWHRQAESGVRAPGILVATLGPGAANAVNVVANAYQDRVPLIVLTGRVDAADAESYTHQVFDHQALFRPVTKATLSASRGAVARVIDRAVRIALDGQPGPVHVDVPISVAEGAEPAHAFARPAPMRPAPAPAGLSEIGALLRASRNPVMIAGVDAVNDGAGPALQAFAADLGVPVLTTYKAKGLIAEDSELALGGIGLSPRADSLVLPFLAEADCILLAGYDPIEMRANWRDPFPPGVPAIKIASTLPTHQMHRADHLLIGDIGAMLAALHAAVGRRSQPRSAAIARLRHDLASAFAPEPEWGPGVVFDTIRRLAPRAALASADSGAHRILLSQMWTTCAPRGLMQSSALCTMGCALPLALGAQLAAPEAVVIAFVGDAGLEMGIGELATARDLGLPVIIVVLQDERLALIDLKQRALGHVECGVRFGGTDFAAVATAFGGAGVNVSDRGGLAAAFAAALARRDRFSLIAARIAPDAYAGRL